MKVRNERCYCGFHREQVKCLCWAMQSHMTTFNIYQEMISLGWHESRTRSVNEHIWLWGGSLNQGFEILKCLEWGRLLIFTWNDDFRVTNTKRLFRGDCVCSWTRHFYHKLRQSKNERSHCGEDIHQNTSDCRAVNKAAAWQLPPLWLPLLVSNSQCCSTHPCWKNLKRINRKIHH